MLSKRGFTLIEVLGCVAVLGILLGTGAQVAFRASSLGRDLVVRTRAVAAAERLMELSKAGLDPRAETEGLPPGFSAKVTEEKFGDTPLRKVTVTVRWRASGSRRSEVRLVSLMR